MKKRFDIYQMVTGTRKMKEGTKVNYDGDAIDDQVKFGCGFDDPREHLVVNQVYTIDKIIIHTWYTEIYLKEIPGKKFNSVHFK